MKIENKMEIIAEQMFALGNKFSQMANSAGSLREAKPAFQLAKEAYALVVKAEIASKQDPIDPTIEFIKSIDVRMLRSKTWTSYIEHCKKYSIENVTKKRFFELLRANNFREGNSGGEIYMTPPRKQLSI